MLNKIKEMLMVNKYKRNGWIPISKPPKKSYTHNFLIVVKDDNNKNWFPCSIWMATWSSFVAGDGFDCWQKTNINGFEYNTAHRIPMDRVLYWRPLPKLPKDIRKLSLDTHLNDPTE